jgi:ABC-type amino acid transport substrate-binding protein
VLAGLGTTSERAVRASLPRARRVAGDKGKTTAERLSARDVDAAALDGPAADALVERSQGLLVRLPGLLAPELYALALPRTSRELRAALDRELARLDREGVLARLDATHDLAPARPSGP